MTNIKIPEVTLSNLPETAKKILNAASQFATGDLLVNPDHKVFAFYGELGVGKTTLIKEICKQLGSRDNFSSPTYSIVNEYVMKGKPDKIYHIDLFRLKNIEEAMSIGIEDYLYGRQHCFIEWPELIEFLLPPGTIKVRLKSENNIREISIFIG